MSHPLTAFLMVSMVMSLWSSDAHAYLDPGTGSMLLTTILGGVAGLLVAGKLFWHQILAKLGLRKDEKDSNSSSQSDNNSTD